MVRKAAKWAWCYGIVYTVAMAIWLTTVLFGRQLPIRNQGRQLILR